jgi:hypothetical protein
MDLGTLTVRLNRRSRPALRVRVSRGELNILAGSRRAAQSVLPGSRRLVTFAAFTLVSVALGIAAGAVTSPPFE